jgi:hypothetical protein
MRNHNCTFANHCDNYGLDHCQGCARASESISIEREVAWIGKWELSQRTNGCGITYVGSGNNAVKKEANMTIKQVYFNKPVTVVLWADGTKTIVKCQEGDTYSKETGLAVAIAKKALGNKGNFNNVFKKWIPEFRKDDTNNVEESAVGYVYFKDGRRERITSHVGDHSSSNGFNFCTRDRKYVALKRTKYVDEEFREYMDYYTYFDISKQPVSWDNCRIDTIDRVEFRKDDTK